MVVNLGCDTKTEISEMRLFPACRNAGSLKRKFDTTERSETRVLCISNLSKFVKVDSDEISETLVKEIYSLVKFVKVDSGEISERFWFPDNCNQGRLVKVDRESTFVMLLLSRMR